jgi:hypothetical protein
MGTKKCECGAKIRVNYPFGKKGGGRHTVLRKHNNKYHRKYMKKKTKRREKYGN